MSVDMSADAVTQRLKTLDELWELSVSLMRAKPERSKVELVNEVALADTPASEEDAAGDI